MNFYTVDMKNKKGKGKAVNKQKTFSFALLLNASIILMIVFSATVYFVTIRAKSEILNKKARSLKARIAEYETEIKHLKIKKEEFSDWRYITRKIKRYHLPLVSPEPYQIRPLYKICKKNKPSKEKDTAIALNH